MVRIEFDVIGELLDTAFSLLGKYGKWLNVKGKRICFIVWNICLLYWMLRDFQLALYSQGCFCLLSIGINFYGLYVWKKKGIA